MRSQHKTTPIDTVLVANRGEIARRVFAACRRAGLKTVAVFSEADADAAFVREADAAVALPGSAPAQTYLDQRRIIEAAAAAGADAVHPGYGFLSESAEFARAVAAAGLTWIGPSAESIEAMGSKVEAKRMMEAAGVPVLGNLDPASVTEADLPVLVKASAGGGGRGMRVVSDLAQLGDTVEAAQREAQSAFGDPTVFCERYIPAGHHIEVQILGDAHGTVWAVGERECSIQRRHQKVVEEAPSPLVARCGEDMRRRLYAAARDAAARIGYVGAGTVEFLADGTGEFFFLEMNTRLQVEHPVTEAVTGIDLVAAQLHIAQGGALTGEPPGQSGHAIEVRLCAEDPAHDWQPQSGPVRRFFLPGVEERFSADAARAALGGGRSSLRLDAAFVDGEAGCADAISPFYDSMIAKVIAAAPDRDEAAARLAGALARLEWDGPIVNRDLLVGILTSEAFLSGHTDTAFLENTPEVFAPALGDAECALAALAASAARASLAESGHVATAAGALARLEWDGPTGEDALAHAIGRDNPRPKIGRFRLFDDLPSRRTWMTEAGQEFAPALAWCRGEWTAPEQEGVRIVSAEPTVVVLEVDGVRRRFAVHAGGDRVTVSSAAGAVTLTEAPRYTDPTHHTAPGSLFAPMPGAIVRVAVSLGDAVVAGQPIMWMEAMKMEHTITADADGTVCELNVSVGDQVEAGAVLAVIGEADDE